jgi:hypothetical protein
MCLVYPEDSRIEYDEALLETLPSGPNLAPWADRRITGEPEYLRSHAFKVAGLGTDAAIYGRESSEKSASAGCLESPRCSIVDFPPPGPPITIIPRVSPVFVK